MLKALQKISMKKQISILALPKTTLNNYKKISLYIPIGISCTFKCKNCCNIHYKNEQPIETTTYNLIREYLENELVDAVILAGLEPFDNFIQLESFISDFRLISPDDIVIYTGYNVEEIKDKLKILMNYKNIIVKFGRYKPRQKPYINNLLGVELASPNQYALKLS